MTPANRPVRGVLTEYYSIEDHNLARINIDFETGEAIEAHILTAGNPWENYPMYSVLSDGVEISKSHAKKLAKKLGGRL